MFLCVKANDFVFNFERRFDCNHLYPVRFVGDDRCLPIQ